MSTIPGDSTWSDAGLSESDLAETVDAAQDPAQDPTGPVAHADQVSAAEAAPGPAEEYEPLDPQPGEVTEANAADVVEQAAAVPDGVGDERR